jgi:hypothetical protein
VSKGEEDTLSCFLFLYQCICVGQPSILLAISFLLDARSSVFGGPVVVGKQPSGFVRWSAGGASGGASNLIWV